MQPPSPPLPIRFPGIPQAARLLGVSRCHLWRALKGTVANPTLAARYLALVLPRLAESLCLAQIPSGSRIELPAAADRASIVAALGSHVSAEGNALTVVQPVAVLPAIPSSPLQPAPAAASRRSKKTVGRLNQKSNHGHRRR